MAFNCPSCKSEEATKLVCSKDGLKCNLCYEVGRPVSYSAMLHRVRKTRFGRLTEADAQRIKTNKKGPDGQFRPDPRWRTTGD